MIVGFQVSGSRFQVSDSRGSRVQGVQGVQEFKVQSSKFKVQGVRGDFVWRAGFW
jgi:hypothetical protein